jgi:hypothetical protein
VAVAPAASPSLLKRQRCTEANNNLVRETRSQQHQCASLCVLRLTTHLSFLFFLCASSFCAQPSHSGLSLFGAASVPALSSARPLLLSTPAKRAPLLSASASSSIAVTSQPQSLLLLRPATAASPMPVALGAAAFMSPAPKSARSALQH